MKFDEIIPLLQSLRDIELQSLNSMAPYVTIVNIDVIKANYKVKVGVMSARTYPFSDLELVWDCLRKNTYANVGEIAISEGSSLNQAETILANLPMVAYFNYNNRNYLYFSDVNTHELASLQALDGQRKQDALKELKTIDKQLPYADNQIQDTDFSSDDGKNLAIVDEEELKDRESDHSSPRLAISRIKLLTITVSLIFDRIKHKDLKLQTEFLRDNRVWPIRNKSKLIESILLGFPLPLFYFAEQPDGSWTIIDGRQRISAIYEFMTGEFELQGLEILTDYNEYYFSQLPRVEQRRIREHELSVHSIQISKNSDSLMKELFYRVNTGGVALSPQEIRTVMYSGSSILFLRYLAEHQSFLDATDRTIPAMRMKDMEFCLGVVSFMLWGYTAYDHNKYDDFLCHTLVTLNQFKLHLNGDICHSNHLPQIDTNKSDDVFIDLFCRIQSGYVAAELIFGAMRYRKSTGNTISKPLFELCVAVFAMMNDEQLYAITQQQHANQISESLHEMILNDSTQFADWHSEVFAKQNRGFAYAISQSTGKRVTIQFRFNSFIHLINQISGINFKFVGLMQAME